MKDAEIYLANRITEGGVIRSQHPDAKITAGVDHILDIFNGVPTSEDIQWMLSTAYDFMQPQIKFTGGSVATPGASLMTATASGIGRWIFQRFYGLLEGDDVLIWKFHLNVGSLILEALMNTGYITLEYCHGQKAYMVHVTERWQYARTYPRYLRGTVEHMPYDITKLRQSNGRTVIKRWDDEEAFEQVLDAPFVKALNKTQQQGWKINKKVYAALLRDRKKYTTLDDSGDELKLQQSISKASEFRSVVAVTSRIRKWEQFYQYAECDYRGRVYFAQPFMNFQGSDVARGIMLFDRPQRVTEKGRKWLARHTACSFNKSYSKSDEYIVGYRDHLDSEGLDDLSVDKMTLADREKWTYDNMEFILETAKNLTLHDCEKPVSFLACCLEWEKYHDNPDVFYSALPIPVDGSNNGWQHLAAISQDERAGKLVGLVPVEIQEDFYVKTAKALKARQPEWFEERDIPMKHIRKGISKRGSMTRAYSAGATKICENMYLDCRTYGYDEQYNIEQKDCFMLARNLIQAIDVVCPGPLQTMKFLQLLATELIEDGNNTISWTTPAGFPVHYKAPRMDKHQHKVTIRGLRRVSLQGQFPTEYPDVRKFMSGISPNFIHSLDAAHMCNVIARWDTAFGGVHDSFSTYADDVDDLLELTKDVFIEQYTPVEGNNFKGIKRMLGLEDTEIGNPSLGNLNIERIRESDYFFA